MENILATDVRATDVVCDVREEFEYDAGHIKDVIHIPVGELMARYDELPLDDQIVVVCRTGGRSAQAVNWLNQHGVDAVNLTGGMDAWFEAGLPIVSETGKEPRIL
ncbi:MAG: rhodanese-like domain-containing protein [Micrococcaceae bacterium]